MAIAYRAEPDGFRNRLEEVNGRERIIDHWVVPVATEAEARVADNLPRDGAAFGPAAPGAIVVGRQFFRQGRGYVVAVVYEYADAVRGGGGVRAREGLVYTAMRPSVESVQFRFERLADGSVGSRIPGDGVPVTVPNLAFVVRNFYPAAFEVPNVAEVYRLYAGKLNDGPVTLPNVGPGFGDVELAAGQLLYLYPSVGLEDGFRFMEHVLEARASFDVVVPVERADGSPTGDLRTFSVHERTNLSNAWVRSFP